MCTPPPRAALALPGSREEDPSPRESPAGTGGAHITPELLCLPISGWDPLPALGSALHGAMARLAG